MWNKINKLTLLSQSLFGIPWILIAVLFAYQDPKVTFPTGFFWVPFFLAFFTARILGMSLNRMIDCEIDGKNPRTKRRPLQIKIISRKEVQVIIIVCTIFFAICCYFLSPLCFFLCPFILFLLYGYSYTKRFSSLCHFFLGSIHFFGPIMAWAALTNSFDIRPVLLGGVVWLLIAANDMVYAIQDLVFDRTEGLKSIPAVLGVDKTIVVARTCHLVAFTLLLVLGYLEQMSFTYYVGAILLAMVYIYYHSEKRNPERTFHQCNLLGGLIMLTSTAVAVL